MNTFTDYTSPQDEQRRQDRRERMFATAEREETGGSTDRAGHLLVLAVVVLILSMLNACEGDRKVYRNTITAPADTVVVVDSTWCHEGVGCGRCHHGGHK